MTDYYAQIDITPHAPVYFSCLDLQVHLAVAQFFAFVIYNKSTDCSPEFV